MTRTATLSASSVASLMKAANAVQLAAQQLEGINLGDPYQLDMFETGAYQACEDFVAEREELKAAAQEARNEAFLAKAQLGQEVEANRVYTGGLRSEIERLSDELVDTSNALHRAREERDQAIDIANAKASEVAKANAVLLHIADFAKQLQEGLGQLGISYVADSETGQPRFTVNLRVLDEAVRDMIDRS